MNEFFDYLQNEKRKAKNTVIAYKRDLKRFDEFMRKERGKSIDDCIESDAVAYAMELNSTNKSKSTINRSISAIRTYFEFKIRRGQISANPFAKIKTSKTEMRDIDYLTIEEIESLIAQTDDSAKGIRDRAIIEFMYGTGSRVSELVRLQFQDLNMRMGFVTLKDVNDNSRIVPLGRYAAEALNNYLENVYPKLKGRQFEGDDFVFVNLRGEVLARQGIWKILKAYAKNIDLESRMTTQILRDSFAVHILENGGDLKTLQELMGFDDMAVGIAYLSVTDIHVREVFARCHPRA